MAEIVAAKNYAGKAIEIARRIKNATDDAALEEAAQEMAKLIPEGAILIPAPSSSGLNRAMAVLAMKVSALVPGSEVVEAVVRSTPVQSSHLLRRAGRGGLSVEDHVASMSLVQSLPDDRPLVAIDNVVTEGSTILAMEHILGRQLLGVVYADAKKGRGVARLGATGAPRPLRICVSGSRGFRSLDKIGIVLSLFPPGTIIVHGGAVGVDERADLVARAVGFEVEVHEPDWERYGRSAGPRRNREMVRSCDYLVAFWDGQSRGTASAIQAAIEEGVDFDVILDD